jgi:AMP-polyphosphate phosphotransferase
MSRLGSAEAPVELSKKKAIARLEEAQERVLRLRLLLGGQIAGQRIGPPLCVVFEGWDASGKGGAIKRLVAPLDPRFVRVSQFAAPTYDEKRHHFLWRFWPKLPGWGGMHVSAEEQMRRFEDRANDPLRAWKLTDEDWRNREKRPAYEAAVNEMLERTDPTWAPWHVIPGDNKHYARLSVVERVCEAVEAELERRGYDV